MGSGCAQNSRSKFGTLNSPEKKSSTEKLYYTTYMLTKSQVEYKSS